MNENAKDGLEPGLDCLFHFISGVGVPVLHS